MKKLKIFGIYGKQKINGVSCLKSGNILSYALKLAGLKPIKEASYTYFDLTNISYHYEKLNPLNEQFAQTTYFVFDDLNVTEAERIYKTILENNKITNSEYTNHWVLLE